MLNNKRLRATGTFLKIANLKILENSIKTSVAGFTFSKVAGLTLNLYYIVQIHRRVTDE